MRWGMQRKLLNGIFLSIILFSQLSHPGLKGQTITNVFSNDIESTFLKSDGSLWTTSWENDWGYFPKKRIDSGIASASGWPGGTILIQKTDGSLWGKGNVGNLGLGYAENSWVNLSTLTQILASGVNKVQSTDSRTLLLKTDGSLWGMGRDQFGELGMGTYSWDNIMGEFSNYASTPISILASGVTDFHSHQNGSNLGFTTLIVKSNGSLWSLGYGLEGALGVTLSGFSDPFIPSWVQYPSGTSTPAEVINSGVSQVSSYSGDGYGNKGKIVYLKTDGSLWGWDLFEPLYGNNTPLPVPTQSQIVTTGVDRLIKASHGALMSSHLLYLKTDGSLWGMGSNAQGQLGIGAAYITTPVQLATDVADAAATMSGTKVVKNDGTVWAMGQSSVLLGLDGQPISSPVLQEVLLEGRTVTISTSGLGSTTGAGGYALGTEANVTATPSAGYAFSHWEGDGVTDTNASSTTVNLDADRTLTAEFTPLSYELNVLSGTGGSASGSGTYSYNSDANLSATPATGYLFDSWTGSGIADATSASTIIRITGDQNVSASFTPIIYDLNLSVGLGGLVDGNGSYAYGSDANLTATPNPGYLFGGWTGDLNSTDANVTVTVTGNLELNATFIQDTNDNDGDNLTNYQELVTHSSDPDNNDTDGDGILDGVEVSVGLSPTVAHTDLMNLFIQREIDARQRGVNDGNASGQALVVANPSAYSLTTEVDKNASDASAYATGLADGNTTGKAYVITNHLLYSLYNQSFKDAMDLGAYLQGMQEGEPLGRSYAQNNPNEFLLYNEQNKTDLAQVAYAQKVTDGNNSGILYTTLHPSEFGLYTAMEKNQSDQQNYDLGLTDGNKTGKLIVQNNPVNFQLFTELEKNASDETARQIGIGEGNTSGIAYAQAYPKLYDLYTEGEVNSSVEQNYNTTYSASYVTGETDALTVPGKYGLHFRQSVLDSSSVIYTNSFSEGNASGITYVISNPRTYDLYSEVDVNASILAKNQAGFIDGNASGVAYASPRPNEYGYFSLLEVQAGIKIIENESFAQGSGDGINEVKLDPSNFGLFTQPEIDQVELVAIETGKTQGKTSGITYSNEFPNQVGLYTEYQVTSSETEYFGEEYTTGQSKGAEEKLAEIKAGFRIYGLSKTVFLEDMKIVPYTRSWYYQPEWGWMLTNEQVFPSIFRAAKEERPSLWLSAGQLRDMPSAMFFDETQKNWISPRDSK